MANVITNPVFIKSKPSVGAEKQVGDSDPSARTDVINRPVKGIVSVMTKWLETFHLSGTFDFTNTTSTGAYANLPFVPQPVSGTPGQHGLFRENVVKAWAAVAVAGGVPSVTDSFNVASITDNDVGDFTLVWDRDFANATYAWAGTTEGPTAYTICGGASFSKAVGSLRYFQSATDGTGRDFPHNITAIGDQ